MTKLADDYHVHNVFYRLVSLKMAKFKMAPIFLNSLKHFKLSKDFFLKFCCLHFLQYPKNGRIGSEKQDKLWN